MVVFYYLLFLPLGYSKHSCQRYQKTFQKFIGGVGGGIPSFQYLDFKREDCVIKEQDFSWLKGLSG